MKSKEEKITPENSKDQYVFINKDIALKWNALRETLDDKSKRILDIALNMAEIINDLSNERIAKGLTQYDLAKICGINQSLISRTESLDTMPRLDTILKMANALGLKIKVEK